MYQTAPDVSSGYQDRAPLHTTRRWQLRQALATADVDISDSDIFSISLALIRTCPVPDACDPIPRAVTDAFAQKNPIVHGWMLHNYGTTSEESPLYQFVQDWRNELQLLITRPDCRLIEYKTTELVVEGYTRTFILLEFIVQQVLNELVSHLGLFGDLPRTHQVLVMIELISYQRRKYDHPQECILRLADLHNISTRLMNFLRHTTIARRGEDAWTELFAQIEAYATYPYPTPVATHPVSQTSWPLISPTVSSCSSYSSLSSDIPEANHISPGSQSTSCSTQHVETTSTSQEPTPNQTLPDALKHYVDNSTKAKALYVDMLKKQEDSMSQLRAACKHFVELENACRDQAKQTFDNLFGGTSATEVVSDVLRAMAPSNTQSTLLATSPPVPSSPGGGSLSAEKAIPPQNSEPLVSPSTASDRAQTHPGYPTSDPIGCVFGPTPTTHVASPRAPPITVINPPPPVSPPIGHTPLSYSSGNRPSRWSSVINRRIRHSLSPIPRIMSPVESHISLRRPDTPRQCPPIQLDMQQPIAIASPQPTTMFPVVTNIQPPPSRYSPSPQIIRRRPCHPDNRLRSMSPPFVDRYPSRPSSPIRRGHPIVAVGGITSNYSENIESPVLCHPPSVRSAESPQLIEIRPSSCRTHCSPSPRPPVYIPRPHSRSSSPTGKGPRSRYRSPSPDYYERRPRHRSYCSPLRYPDYGLERPPYESSHRRTPHNQNRPASRQSYRGNGRHDRLLSRSRSCSPLELEEPVTVDVGNVPRMAAAPHRSASRSSSRRSHRPPTEVEVQSRGRTSSRYEPRWPHPSYPVVSRSPSPCAIVQVTSRAPSLEWRRSRRPSVRPVSHCPSKRTLSRCPSRCPSKATSKAASRCPSPYRIMSRYPSPYPYRRPSRSPSITPADTYDENHRSRPRSQTPSYYIEHYRERSHSPRWYAERRRRNAQARSVASDAHQRRSERSRSRSPLCQHIILSRPATPLTIYEPAVPAKAEKLSDVERQIRDVVQKAEEAEKTRQEAFRRSEEARDRIFKENEARRDQDIVQWKDQLKRDLEGHFAALHALASADVPVPDKEAVEYAESEETVESAIPERPCRDETAPQDVSIAEIVRNECEAALGRLFDAFTEDRKHHDRELIEEHERLHEERVRRVGELEEELARVRQKLEDEKRLREAEEAERREMEVVATIERHEDQKGRLDEIIDLAQEQREMFRAHMESNEERWEEKMVRRDEKKEDIQTLREMLSESLAAQHAMKESFEEDKASFVTKSDLEDLVEDLRRNNCDLREMLETFTDSCTSESKAQYSELVQIIQENAPVRTAFDVQESTDTSSASAVPAAGHPIFSSDSTREMVFKDSLQRIQNLKQRFDDNLKTFSFPRLVDVGVDSSGTNCKTVDTTAIYCSALMTRAPNEGTKRKRYTMYFGSEGGHRIHQYLHSLDQLLLDLAKVSSGGDEDVKTRGGAVMGQIVKEINTVEQWKISICEMASMLEGV